MAKRHSSIGTRGENVEQVVVPALLLRRLPSERVATLRIVAPALVPLKPSVMAVQDAV